MRPPSRAAFQAFLTTHHQQGPGSLGAYAPDPRDGVLEDTARDLQTVVWSGSSYGKGPPPVASSFEGNTPVQPLVSQQPQDSEAPAEHGNPMDNPPSQRPHFNVQSLSDPTRQQQRVLAKQASKCVLLCVAVPGTKPCPQGLVVCTAFLASATRSRPRFARQGQESYNFKASGSGAPGAVNTHFNLNVFPATSPRRRTWHSSLAPAETHREEGRALRLSAGSLGLPCNPLGREVQRWLPWGRLAAPCIPASSARPKPWPRPTSQSRDSGAATRFAWRRPASPFLLKLAFLSGFCRYPMPGGNGTEAVCRLSWVALQPVGPGGTAGGTLGRLAARCTPPSVQSCAPLCGRRARTRHSARPRPRNDIRTYRYLVPPPSRGSLCDPLTVWAA